MIAALLIPSASFAVTDRDNELANTWTDTWTDPVVGWTWHVAAIATDWTHALTACPTGSELPDQATLRYSVKRMQKGVLGAYFHEKEIHFAWTSEEFDWNSSMAVHVFDGFSRNIWKRDFLAVLCVAK